MAGAVVGRSYWSSTSNDHKITANGSFANMIFTTILTMPVSEMFIVQCQMSYWGYPSIGLHPRLVPTIAYLRSAVVVVVTTIISILKSIQADKSKLSAIYHN